MSWSHSRVSADSASDLEEQPVPLMTRRQGGSVRLGLCASLLVVAVCMVGLAPRLLGVAHLSQYPKRAALSGTMQAFAMERLGRSLKDDEVDKLYSHVSGVGHARARALMDRFALEGSHSSDRSDDSDPMEKAFNVSEVCMNGIQDKMKDVLKSFAVLLIEAFFGCVLGDEESGACVVATDKMDHLLDDMVDRCQEQGDFCNVTVVGKQDAKLVADSIGACVPKVCHAEAKQAIACFKEQLGEEIADAQAQAAVDKGATVKLQAEAAKVTGDDCDNCTIDIECTTSKVRGNKQQHFDREHLK